MTPKHTAERIVKSARPQLSTEPLSVFDTTLIEAITEAIKDAEAAARREGERAARDDRQREISAWASATFGADQASSVPQRALRMLEEAIEAYQAASGDRAMAHKLVDYMFARPKGELAQEIGGVGLTLLCLAEAAGLSADERERAEIERVKAKSIEHFRARNQAKNDAGFCALVSPVPAQPAGGIE